MFILLSFLIITVVGVLAVLGSTLIWGLKMVRHVTPTEIV